ncbi:oligopeptide/dipeptide ABC transporter ATP-binding protein [Spinactinospora alkalitolerans]|uniref:Oligopeptide/dipeptide ABC transporter ATP-binding protein n=1 Tax=Spinactinospora alkalitolerans TaxID=687207 RepID=A0A852U1I2_9ACTN|nr:ABC transporter ATP-binding protein [Spinactinospora alkalitolerans]NYE47850.1 oligopeptide/dipeptide ABC transporter ATP-binding protein [Spinactinospora alkalitolerans]
MSETGHREAAVRVSGLTLGTSRDRAPLPLVSNVSFEVRPGEMLGLVGESGSGKTLTGSAVAGLLPRGVRRLSGEIELAGGLAEGEGVPRRSRSDLAMVFQNPMTSLNPSVRIGDQVMEAVRLNRPKIPKREAGKEALAVLERVEIPRAEERMRQYPFEFSGGMRQRVMIAIAIATNPKVLIADEPTTALDVTVQQGVMDLIDRLRAELGLAVLLISHDLAVVSERCDRLLVMYAGEIVESGDARTVLDRPLHPYVDGLMRCIPEVALRLGELRSLPGGVPAPGDMPAGCRFAPRCGLRVDACVSAHPPLEEVRPGRGVRCVRAGDRVVMAGGRDV